MFDRIKEFFSGVRYELKKVNWPSWDELKSSTTVVLVFSIFVTLFIAIVDLGVGTLVRKLIDWM
ncbi:MAG: preprotein translocase subunit SecE [Candidatus Neomarinimicrobiota bacterium]|nr:preprotein translocase subunit SecE [Candidatus Neomarinimicrobiota bacterium]RKY53227.1 MAG: preprotein translocase subunit SecE [Candidatus Neomarinimicrobiota bacterium]